MAAAIAQANSRAYALADLALAATIMVGTGEPARDRCAAPPDDAGTAVESRTDCPRRRRGIRGTRGDCVPPGAR